MENAKMCVENLQNKGHYNAKYIWRLHTIVQDILQGRTFL